MPGIMIAGTHSGCGKTTITMGILAALKERGLTVQPFKAGPDFIDAGLHRMITGRPSRNLDIWMCGEDYVVNCYKRHASEAEIAVVEGVMGLYDGNYSSAYLASLLNIPVVLIIDAYGMAESAGAVAQGFASFCPPSLQGSGRNPLVSGVIFNRVASAQHFKRLKKCVGSMPVLGFLPRDQSFSIPERHLGLMVAEEAPLAEENMMRLACAVKENIHLDEIIELSRKESFGAGKERETPRGTRETPGIRIAYAQDRAFSFYYEDNLDLLAQAGADLIPFSPLSAAGLPGDVAALYLGGGYPELWASDLALNTSLLKEIRNLAARGLAIYAECGGLVYLSRGIYDLKGNFFPLLGLVPFATRMKRKRAQLGYREVTLEADCLLGPKGRKLRGHEYHYSEILWEERPDLSYAYKVTNNNGLALGLEGYQVNNILASYLHLHFGGCPEAAQSFIKKVKEIKWKTSSL